MLDFLVTGENGGQIIYHADYVKVEGGALVFRNVATSVGNYPELVAMVAAGFWRDVKVKR